MAPQISINPLFDFDAVDYSKESDVHLDVIFEAPQKDDESRKPLHLILAADCSGSMAGSKLESLKDTLKKLVENLVEDDTIGIIGFSQDVWEVLPVLPMTQANKKQAEMAIGGLRTRGSTNLSEAMTVAMEKAVISDKDKISRVILLTDGLPTYGKCRSEELVEVVGKMNQRISMTTFGYGSDYDPELLTSLSRVGRGNNFYIQEDEDCKKAFALELGGLLSMMAQDIKVTLSFSDNFTVHDFLSDYKISQSKGYRGIKGPKIEFTIDDIYFGEKKHAVVKLGVPSASEAVCARPTRVCGIEVDYMDVEQNQRQNLESAARIQYSKTPQEEGNLEVRKQLMMLEAARIQKEAKEKADQGDYSGAQEVLTGAIAWANNNPWYDGANSLRQSFEVLSSNCSDRFTYSTRGAKMATAYACSFSTGRGASGQTLGSFSTVRQKQMLKSFGVSEDETQKKITGKVESVDSDHDTENV